jgi:hypothetical protein
MRVARELIKPNTAVAFVNATGWLGMSLWLLGYPEQARKQHARVRGLLGEPIVAVVQRIGFELDCQMSEFMHDNRRILEAAERTVTLARETGFTAQLGHGMI